MWVMYQVMGGSQVKVFIRTNFGTGDHEFCHVDFLAQRVLATIRIWI